MTAYPSVRVGACSWPRPALPLSPPSGTHPQDSLPPKISLSQFDSGVPCSFLNVLRRPRDVCLLGSPGVSVLPTRKVHSLRTYKHLRLLTGTPRLTRVIQTSLFMAVNDILRESNSGFTEQNSTERPRPPWAEDRSRDTAVHVFRSCPQELPFRLKHSMTPGLLPPC